MLASQHGWLTVEFLLQLLIPGLHPLSLRRVPINMKITAALSIEFYAWWIQRSSHQLYKDMQTSDYVNMITDCTSIYSSIGYVPGSIVYLPGLPFWWHYFLMIWWHQTVISLNGCHLERFLSVEVCKSQSWALSIATIEHCCFFHSVACCFHTLNSVDNPVTLYIIQYTRLCEFPIYSDLSAIVMCTTFESMLFARISLFGGTISLYGGIISLLGGIFSLFGGTIFPLWGHAWSHLICI